METPILTIDDIEGTITALARYRAARSKQDEDFNDREIMSGLSDTMTPELYRGLVGLISCPGSDLDHRVHEFFEGHLVEVPDYHEPEHINPQIAVHYPLVAIAIPIVAPSVTPSSVILVCKLS